MPKIDKLLQKVKNSPNNLRFEEICHLAESYGWIFQRQDGTSHAVYLHPALGNSVGALMNFQSKKGMAKRYQVKQLLDAIELLGELDKEKEDD
ncbi:MAG: hypothetical protein SF097_12275 [Acidobacteriota bacterium]|nr:hypothetical protein [Acidobacteriota bacterium]